MCYNTLTFDELLEKLEYNLHNTCVKYKLYFKKINGKWTINNYVYNNQYYSEAMNILKENIPTYDDETIRDIENLIIRHRNDKKDGKIELCLTSGITIIANPYILIGIAIVLVGGVGYIAYNEYKRSNKEK